MRRFVLSLAVSCFAVSPAALLAGDAKEMKPLLAEKGQPLLTDDFSGSKVDSRWQAAKGAWAVENGALKGTELEADHHAASIRTTLDHTDAVYQFDFQFADTGKTIHLSINGGKGHICRVTITPDGFQVRKDGSKTDASDKGALLDSSKMAFEKGKTYTMLVEVVGPNIIARVDDQHYAFGSDPKVGSQKTNFGFPISGAGTIDNVRVWEAKANPDWEKAKDTLAAHHPERMAPAAPAGKKAPAKKAPAKKAPAKQKAAE